MTAKDMDTPQEGKSTRKQSKEVSMQGKPTPTPWVAEGLPVGFVILGDVRGRDEYGVKHTETVAEVGQSANAAFIVRAVNCHEELLAYFIDLAISYHVLAHHKNEDFKVCEAQSCQRMKRMIAKAERK